MDSAETPAELAGLASGTARDPAQARGLTWPWAQGLTKRLLLAFTAMDVAFKALVLPAYLSTVGTRPGMTTASAWTLAILLFLVVDAAWLAALRATLLPIERWLRAEDRGGPDTRSLMASAGAALHALPTRSALLWSAEWVVFVSVYTVLAGDVSAPLPLGLFLAAMALGPLPLAHTLTVWLSLSDVRRLTRAAQRIKRTAWSPSTPLRGRLVLYSLALALAPALYMASALLSPRAQHMGSPGRAAMVWLFLGAIIVFGVFCALLFASTITQPIATMTGIVREIARQGGVPSVGRIPQERPDEIGVPVSHAKRMIDRLEHAETSRASATDSLAALNRSLENRVDERTAKLQRANESLAREMVARAATNAQVRLMLDHVGQGFLCLDRAGAVSGEVSAAAEQWFGPAPAGVPVWDYFRDKDPKFATWLEVSWTALIEEVLPVDLLLAQLPERILHAGRTYGVDYRRVPAEGELSCVVMVVSDVSTLVERERGEASNREVATTLDQLIRDRAGVVQFVLEADAMVSELAAGSPHARRLIHTLKGNCAAYAIRSVASVCHAVEEALEGSSRGPTPDEIAPIREAWTAFFEPVRALVRFEASVIEISDGELAALRALVRREAPYAALDREIAELRYEPASRPLARAAAQAVALARRLGKGRIEATVDAGTVRVAPERWSELWAAFLHAVRNSVDHGLEAPEERLAAGKPAAGRLALSARLENGTLTVEIRDDGRGIEWTKVADRARRAGLAHTTHDDLVAALFADGFSTRDEVTETSGRGVGMGALLSASQSLGGSIEVESWPGQGTAMRIRVPASSRMSIPPPALDEA